MMNTMNKSEFITEHFWWLAIIILWCIRLIFRCIPGCTYWQSIIVFAAIFVTVSGAGIAINFKSGRNYWSLFQNLICSCGLYIVLAYFELYTNKIIRVMLIAAAASVIGSMFILLGKGERSNRSNRVLRRLCRVACFWRSNTSIALLVLMVPLLVKVIFTGTIMNANTNFSVPVYGDEYSMDANMEKLINLQDKHFSKLTIEEKLDLCSVVFMVEARYLGIDTEINVCAADLEDDTLGYYRDDIHVVCIDIEHLKNDSSYEIVKTCLHEVYHIYQHRLIDVYHMIDENSQNLQMFRIIGEYADEMENYESADDGTYESFYKYYTQEMEVMARKYSEDGVDEYFERINEYELEMLTEEDYLDEPETVQNSWDYIIEQ